MSQIIQQQTPLPNVHIDISDVSMWRQALNTTKSGKARGYDGWYVDDLKALPDTCLQTLAHIFQQRYTKEPFPPSLMQIITLPMGKNIILEHNQKLDQSLYSHNLSPASQSGV
jgi:hypothetical protein